jgi:hypothetical protein
MMLGAGCSCPQRNGVSTGRHAWRIQGARTSRGAQLARSLRTNVETVAPSSPPTTLAAPMRRDSLIDPAHIGAKGSSSVSIQVSIQVLAASW